MAGAARFVGRSRGTEYRGRIAIHAHTRTPRERPTRETLEMLGIQTPEDVVRGAILGTVELVNVVHAGSSDARQWGLNFETFADGPYFWILVNAWPLHTPVPCRGRAGTWLADIDGKRREKGCIYCGATTNLTRDHIPPSAIFPRKPQGAITVRACKGCNEKYSEDDVYLRDVLIAHREAGDGPEVRDVLQAAVRSISYTEQAKYTSRFFSAVRLVNPITPAGILLPRDTALVLDTNRLERIIERIVRGLFYHEFRERIPYEYGVHSFCVTDRLRQFPAETRSFIGDVFPVFNWSPIRVVQDGVFSYRLSLVPRDPFMSFWLFAFYAKVHFYACVTDEGVHTAH
jgi:hypothetical protein